MEETSKIATLGTVPQLELEADEENAHRLSQLWLVGKVLSPKIVKKNIVQSIIRHVWFTDEEVRVDHLHPNVFLFCLKSVLDRNRIWRKRPWSINGAHLVLREWRPDSSFEEINFHLSTFWIQIHGLPLQYMTRENALKIRGLFPTVLQCEYTSRTNIIGMKYMRLQVEVDTSKPLLKGFFQKVGNGGSWIKFAYERLAEFCYNCGKLEHGKGICTEPPSAEQSSEENSYGPWMRAKATASTAINDRNYLRRMELP
ncbi:uncharacterized protein LOC132803803 [Ziziphus jujuba]|uniref:Uncharacterized protein LOC132803803 n=1 Tax=Ziziphus jujuba TaxID=326968 RepID=A0ABM4A9C5_ZIZJJ|nr:uncharacterized protein LOC132803803 [Ziziphus jujuba]